MNVFRSLECDAKRLFNHGRCLFWRDKVGPTVEATGANLGYDRIVRE